MLNKRLVQNIKYFDFLEKYPKYNIGSFMISLLCVFLMMITTFTQLKLGSLDVKTWANINWNLANFDINYYIPQIPMVIFIGALLGPRLGLLPIAIYVVLGLCGIPIFASGGGINYIAENGFGYILGYFAGIYFTGSFFIQKITNKTLLKASLLGVLAIHLTGILYLLILTIFQHGSLFNLANLIWGLSFKQIPYDVLLSFAAICLARPTRGIFWAAIS